MFTFLRIIIWLLSQPKITNSYVLFSTTNPENDMISYFDNMGRGSTAFFQRCGARVKTDITYIHQDEAEMDVEFLQRFSDNIASIAMLRGMRLCNLNHCCDGDIMIHISTRFIPRTKNGGSSIEYRQARDDLLFAGMVLSIAHHGYRCALKTTSNDDHSNPDDTDMVDMF